MDTEPRSAASKQTIRFNRRIENVIIPLIESADALLYTLVGLVFLAGAAGMLGYSVWSFPSNVENPDTGGFPFAIITLINDLLLVMIIMEVLRTVLSYLAERGGSLRPFLFIASISATRRILAIGAQSTIGEKSTEAQFRHLMIDLGVNGAVVLALAAALYLFGHERAKTAEARQMGDDGSEDSSLDRNAPAARPDRYGDNR